MYEEYYDNYTQNSTTTNAETYDSQTFNAASQEQKKSKTKKKWTGGKVAAIAVSCALLGGLAGVGSLAYAAGGLDLNRQTVLWNGVRNQTAAVQTALVDTTKEMTPGEVYYGNVESTVGITTQMITTNYWGFQTQAAAAGSGFIVTEDGYIVTNYHVVQGSSSIKVTMYDNSSYDATLVGYDESNDVAVLKIDATGLSPVVLGDSDSLRVGDSVVAIGNPLGELTFSLTGGMVSALDREIPLQNGTMLDLIQTDAAINSGNSGGALFNLHGEVIGITNAKYSSNGYGEASIDNIGFAIPINNVMGIVTSLIENGYVSKPYIGITVINMSEEMKNYGLPEGVAVNSVLEGGPAEAAGLQKNDIITAVNGEAVTDKNDLVKRIRKCAVGDVLTLTVYRKGETMEIQVTVAENVQDTNQNKQQETASDFEQPGSSDGSHRQDGQSEGSSDDWEQFSGDLFNYFGFDQPFGYGY